MRGGLGLLLAVLLLGALLVLGRRDTAAPGPVLLINANRDWCDVKPAPPVKPPGKYDYRAGPKRWSVIA